MTGDDHAALREERRCLGSVDNRRYGCISIVGSHVGVDGEFLDHERAIPGAHEFADECRDSIVEEDLVATLHQDDRGAEVDAHDSANIEAIMSATRRPFRTS